MTDDRGAAISATRSRMRAVMTPNQILGRTQAIGCTAVEITQRCNLDCTLCYLSEHSEAVADLPLEEVLRRLDEIRRTYGPGTNVQITGGDPTLRKHNELEAIVRHARAIGLYPALFTNGIAATRPVLQRLARAGLADVAFHVDTTQQRNGYGTESDLNAVRIEYLERARGLGLAVIFNTTVHAGNLDEVPMLTRFFVANADVIGFASFQLQADTGRGIWGGRGSSVSIAGVRARIENACGRVLPWDVARIGHPQCHSYVPTLVLGGAVHAVIDDQHLFDDYLDRFTEVGVDRRMRKRAILAAHLAAAARNPAWCLRALGYLGRRSWAARRDLLRARGRVHKLSFFVHNFMDGAALDPARIEACSFMVMTADGPISMCAHNGQRDAHILKPILVHRRDGTTRWFEPLAEHRRGRRGRMGSFAAHKEA